MSHAGLSGQIIALTGGASGIGALVEARLLAAGATVYSLRRQPDKAAAGTIEHIAADLRDAESLDAAAAEIERRLDGRQLTGLVNCAAVWTCASFESSTPEEIKAQLVTNLLGPLLLTHRLLPYLRGETPATIVNVSSLPGRQPMALHVAYGASKAGLLAANHALASELRESNVRVAAIVPGAVLGSGMTARAGGRPPWTFGAVRDHEVAGQILDALQRPRLERIVCRIPGLRLMLAVAVLSPGFGQRLVRLLGVDRYHHGLAALRLESERSR